MRELTLRFEGKVVTTDDDVQFCGCDAGTPIELGIMYAMRNYVPDYCDGEPVVKSRAIMETHRYESNEHADHMVRVSYIGIIEGIRRAYGNGFNVTSANVMYITVQGDAYVDALLKVCYSMSLLDYIWHESKETRKELIDSALALIENDELTSKQFEFTIKVVGSGTTVAEAWEDAAGNGYLEKMDPDYIEHEIIDIESEV